MPNVIKKPQRTQITNSLQSKTLKEHLSSLGFIVWWDFNGQSWTPEKLRQLSKACNLDVSIKDIPVSHAVTKAIGAFSMDRGSIGAITVGKDSGVITIGIMQTTIDTTCKKAEGIQIDKVVYDLKNQSYVSNGSTPYAAKLQEIINKRLTHYSGLEFRQWILMPLIKSCGAEQLMRGNYYISTQYEKTIDAFELFCEACGVKFHVLTQANDSRTQKGLERKVSGNLHDDIEKIRKNLKKYVTQESVRSDGISNIEKQIKSITDRSTFLKEALSVGMNSVDKIIVEAQKELEKLKDQQPTEKKTSNRVLQAWKNALTDKYALKKDGKVKAYRIPFTDFEKLLLPDTATKKFYWDTNQRLPTALAMLGFKGEWRANSLMLRPIK